VRPGRVAKNTAIRHRPDYSITPQKRYVYDQSASLGSLGRLGHAYTCPASTSDCSSSSTWITDLGFVYTSRRELSDVWELRPHSNGAYYHVSATYWANGLINTLNTRLSGLPTWTYNPEGEGRVTTVIASSGQNPVPTGTPVSYNVWGLPNGVTLGSGGPMGCQSEEAGGPYFTQAAIFSSIPTTTLSRRFSTTSPCRSSLLISPG
jgi:hypothetical protein